MSFGNILHPRKHGHFTTPAQNSAPSTLPHQKQQNQESPQEQELIQLYGQMILVVKYGCLEE